MVSRLRGISSKMIPHSDHVQSQVLALIPGIRHGFGTQKENIPCTLDPEWTGAHPSWKQVHGVAHCEVRDERQICGDVDALHTRAIGIPVAVVTADCVPILLAKKNGQAIAAIHAGWRGTLAGAVLETWKHFAATGEKTSDWVAAIGPAIGPCCYEVSEELIQDFQQKKSALSPSLISPSFRKLDLPAIHQAELAQLGFSEVDLIRMCTRCQKRDDGGFMFQSYRRDQNKDRQYSGLVISR
jgi:polyphenol oxidase